eukprot:7390956-Alexandrium_andersonii.AAC.1
MDALQTPMVFRAGGSSPSEEWANVLEGSPCMQADIRNWTVCLSRLQSIMRTGWPMPPPMPGRSGYDLDAGGLAQAWESPSASSRKRTRVAPGVRSYAAAE